MCAGCPENCGCDCCLGNCVIAECCDRVLDEDEDEEEPESWL